MIANKGAKQPAEGTTYWFIIKDDLKMGFILFDNFFNLFES